MQWRVCCPLVSARRTNPNWFARYNMCTVPYSILRYSASCRCELIYWSAKVYFVRFFFLLLPGLPHHRAKHVQRPISLSRSDIKMLRKSAKESNFTEKVRKQSLFIVIMYSFPVSDRANPSSHNSQITRALELNVQMRSMMAESSC